MCIYDHINIGHSKTTSILSIYIYIYICQSLINHNYRLRDSTSITKRLCWHNHHHYHLILKNVRYIHPHNMFIIRKISCLPRRFCRQRYWLLTRSRNCCIVSVGSLVLKLKDEVLSGYTSILSVRCISENNELLSGCESKSRKLPPGCFSLTHVTMVSRPTIPIWSYGISIIHDKKGAGSF